MWNSNSLDQLARQFQKSDELKEHQEQKNSIKEELQSPSRYGQKEAWSEGGMKQIYQIYDYSTGRHLAMAELKPDLENDFSEPFLREARLTATLDHPNIISIHEIGLHEDGSPFFTMDFLSNRTLEQLFYEHREKSDQQSEQLLFNRLDIFLKVCDAISYAHSRGIVHLDIKLSNIHIGLYGEVWVCDWGLGKSLEEPEVTQILTEKQGSNRELNEIWTRQYGIKGTPGSIAPEQIRGYQNANKKSDIYSLGCLLYELTLLEKPFHGNEEEVLQNIQKGRWEFPKEKYIHHLPNSLKAVISKCLSLDEEDRYENVLDLKKEIERYMGGHPTQAEQAGILVELSLFIKRHKWTSLIAISFTCLIILITAVFVLQLKAKTKEAQEHSRLAEEHQVKAEYVAEQYRQEKKMVEEHRRLISTNDRSYHDVLLSGLIFKEPQKSVSLVLRRLNSINETSPNYHWSLEKLVYAHFLKQDFEKAILAYQKLEEQSSIDIQRDLYEVSLKYQNQNAPNGLLPLQLFSKMLLDLKEVRTMKRTHLVEKMLSYDQDVRGKSNYFQVIKSILMHWHEKWDGTGFNMSEKTQTLKISSPHLKMFTYINISSDRCILRFLEFDHLVLSNSGVYDLSHFDDLSLASLDITKTQINTILQVNQFKNLDKVITQKGQFPQKELNKVHRNIKIITK